MIESNYVFSTKGVSIGYKLLSTLNTLRSGRKVGKNNYEEKKTMFWILCKKNKPIKNRQPDSPGHISSCKTCPWFPPRRQQPAQGLRQRERWETSTEGIGLGWKKTKEPWWIRRRWKLLVLATISMISPPLVQKQLTCLQQFVFFKHDWYTMRCDVIWWWCEVGPPGMWNLSISRSRSSTGVEKERYVVRNVCKYIAITLARKQIPITSYSHLFLVFPFIANLHEHGGGVDVVGQSLHQFDKCRSLWGEILHWSWESFLSCISSVLHIIFLKSYHL